jgi:hypothetical protein
MTRGEQADRSCAVVAEALSAAVCGPPDGSAGFGVRRPSALRGW